MSELVGREDLAVGRGVRGGGGQHRVTQRHQVVGKQAQVERVTGTSSAEE